MSRTCAALAAVVCALPISGCRQDEIAVYRVAKSAPQPPEAARAGMPEGHPPLPGAEPAPAAGEGGAELRWQAPAGWKETPGTGMRKATFRVGAKAELSVIALAGDAGGNLSNANRWRGQLGLEPLPEGALASAAEKVGSAAGSALVVDFLGADGASRLLGAMLPHDGQTWFFKLTGPDAEVRAAKPAFVSFLKSLRGARA